jgi:hypothetical protein
LPGALWKREVTVLGPLTRSDVEAHARRVDVSDLQVGPFLEAQPTGGDGGETHAIARPCEVRQNGADRFETKDDGECLGAWGSDEGQRGHGPPVAGRP